MTRFGKMSLSFHCCLFVDKIRTFGILSKFPILIVISILALTAEATETIDLLANDTKTLSLRKDTSFFYFDSYINDCLSDMEQCRSGFTLVFNLSLAEYDEPKERYDSSYFNGRKVLASTGGDSQFTPGGFYMHHVNVRADSYLEIGVRTFDRLFATNIYLKTLSPLRLAVVWKNSELSVFVDGRIHKRINEILTRETPFYSLNYNPIRNFKTAISHPKSTQVFTALFKDQALKETDIFIKGKQENSISHLARQPENNTALMVRVKASASSSTLGAVQVDQPIGFIIDFANTVSKNFRTHVTFDSDNQFSIIGKGMVFTEFTTPGKRKAKFTSTSISDPSLTLSTELDLNIEPKFSIEPMNSIKLIVSSEVTNLPYKVFISWIASGGAPYICSLDFGDSETPTEFKCNERLTITNLTHEYKTSGIYKLSFKCRSLLAKDSELTDSQLVYVRESEDYEESGVDFKQLYFSRPTKVTNQILKLELPFKSCSPGLKLQVIDQYDGLNLFDWLCENSQELSENGHKLIILKASNLKNKYENYLSIRLAGGDMNIGNILVTWQDMIEIAPKINELTTNKLRLDHPYEFEVVVAAYIGSMVKVDFGDGTSNTFILQESEIKSNFHKFKFAHTYKKRPGSQKKEEFIITVKQANYISQKEESKNLVFELALTNFVLKVDTNYTLEINSKPILFKIMSSKTDSPVTVTEIKLIFNKIKPDKFILFKNYTFNTGNNFALEMSHIYDEYGIIDALVNCSNSISSQLIEQEIRVGRSIDSIEGYVVNPYSNVDSTVTLFVNVFGGNGFTLNWDLDNGRNITISWSQIKNKIKSDIIDFTETGGILLSAKYANTGDYVTKLEVRNSFGRLVFKPCSPITVLSARSNQRIQANDSCSIHDNTVLLVNSKIIQNFGEKNSLKNFLIGKGIKNTFSLSSVNCSSSNSVNELNMRWYLNGIHRQFVPSLSKNIEYEKSMEPYCKTSNNHKNAIFESNTLKPGEYLLQIFVFDHKYPEEFISLRKRIEVGASPLIIRMMSPTNIELNWNEFLELDFIENSYDPDDLNSNELDALKFYLMCVKDEETSNNELAYSLLKSTENNIKLGDFDFSPLNLSLAFKAPNLNVYDRGCFSTKTQMHFSESDRKLVVSAKEILLNQTETKPMILQVFMTKDNRFAASDHIELSLNLSSVFKVEPSFDLDEMEDQLNVVDELVKKNPKKALGMLGAFANAINNREVIISSNMNITTTTRAVETNKLSNLRGKMLGTVDKIVGLVSDTNSFLVACDTTSSVTSNTDQMPTENQDQGANVMHSMGKNMKSLKSDEESIKNIAGSMLGTTGNVFVAASGSVPTIDRNSTEIDLFEGENDTYVEPPPIPAKIEAPIKFYETDSEMFPEELWALELETQRLKEEADNALRKKTADIAGRTFEGISNAGGAMASNSNGTGNATKIQSEGMALIVQKQNFNASDNSTNDQFSSDSGPSIVMPSLNKLINNSDDAASSSISTKMFTSSSNPFQSSNADTQANGAIVSMELTDNNGEPISVNNTAEPFVIKVPAQDPPRLYDGSIDLIGMNYYKTILLTNTSSLHVVVIPNNPGDLFHLYIKYSKNPKTDELKYPDEENYDYVFTLPTNATYSKDKTELKYTAFVGQDRIKGSGAYYIGLKLFKLSEKSKEFKKSMINDTEVSNVEMRVNFTMRLFTTSCKYWKAESSEWLTDGCYVSNETTYETTVCHCYHLTTFGTDMYVPPNTIDFGSVFSKFNIGDNPAVFATVLSIFGLYIIIAIFARYKDKKDLIKWGVTPLPDNLPTDGYYYALQVQTGVGKECGTKSKIGFVLAGENSDSGVRKLNDEKRKAFKSGSICNFLMSTEEPLGSLLYLRIWHDNSGRGSNKSWYLNMVNVVDLQTNEKSSFVCNNWLAVEKGDGLSDRVLTLACNNDITKFKHLFTQSVKKKFTDNHMWFSVFSRPTRSNFTRLQRISCCISVLFCTMIANAMFYKAEPRSVQPLVKLGPLKFTMAQVFTSIISSLIVIPVNLIIVTLFRKSKLKTPKILPGHVSHVVKQQYWRHRSPSSISMPYNNNTDHDNHQNDNNKKRTFLSQIKFFFSNTMRTFLKMRSGTSGEYKRDQIEDAKNKKAGRNLPYWCIYISWVLCFVSMIVPAFFVILYSMQWGKERSNAWLGSISLSFFQSLLIMDPLKVFVITAIITFLLRKPDKEGDGIIDSSDPMYQAILSQDEEFLHKSMSSLTDLELREIREARRKVMAKLEPIDPVNLELQRIARLNKIKMNEILREGASYLAFLIVVIFLTQQIKSPDSNNVHTDLSRTFLTNSPIQFKAISTRKDFWLYLEKVLLENLYSPNWYNNKTLIWREKLTITNRNAIRVGAARIRQLRVKRDTCKLHSKVKDIFDHCHGDYNFVDDDTQDYDIGWISVNESSPLTTSTTPRPGKKPSKYKCQSAWCYQNSIQTKSIPIVGKFTTYKGGGYVVTLGRTREKSLELIDELKENNWIDELTRAVFFEFTVFNPNVNLFSSATLIVEFLNIGSAVTYESIAVFSLYNYLGSFGVIVMIFQIIFVIFTIYFLVHEIFQIKKLKCGYFKQFWNLNEFLIIVFSIISMAMFSMRTIFTNLAIKDVHETEMAGFVNFNTLAQWNEIYTIIVSIIVFCASLKFLKLLRFNKRIGMLAATLRYAAKDLLSFSFTFGVFFFAFTMVSYCVFGPYMDSYKSFMSSLGSQFRFALGQYDFNGLINSNLILGCIYFVGFILIVIMGLMSMFVAILSEAFEKVKEDLKTQKNEHELLSFISGAINKLKKKSKIASSKHADNHEDEIVSSLDIQSLSVTIKEPISYSSTIQNIKNMDVTVTNKNRLPRRLDPINSNFTNIYK